MKHFVTNRKYPFHLLVPQKSTILLLVLQMFVLRLEQQNKHAIYDF